MMSLIIRFRPGMIHHNRSNTIRCIDTIVVDFIDVDDITKEIKNKFYNRMPSSFPELNLVNNREIFSSQRPSYAGQWTIRKSLKGWYYE